MTKKSKGNGRSERAVFGMWRGSTRAPSLRLVADPKQFRGSYATFKVGQYTFIEADADVPGTIAVPSIGPRASEGYSPRKVHATLFGFTALLAVLQGVALYLANSDA